MFLQRVCSLFRKKECWPDYPELPYALTFSSTLTKNWTPLLNPSAASAFFPASGMKKQDDAIAGCQIISKAVAFELENSLVRSHIIDQVRQCRECEERSDELSRRKYSSLRSSRLLLSLTLFLTLSRRSSTSF